MMLHDALPHQPTLLAPSAAQPFSFGDEDEDDAGQRGGAHDAQDGDGDHHDINGEYHENGDDGVAHDRDEGGAMSGHYDEEDEDPDAINRDDDRRVFSDGEDEEEKVKQADRVLSGAEQRNVTVKDVQEAINVSHPFGLKIWKSALYKKSRSINALTYSDLHETPSTDPSKTGLSAILSPGNVLWAVLFGWWLALAYIIVGSLILGPFALVGYILSYVPIIGGAGKEFKRTWEYIKVLFHISGYVFWPFGKFIAKRRRHVNVFDPKLPTPEEFLLWIPGSEEQRQPDTPEDIHANETTALLNDYSSPSVVIGMPDHQAVRRVSNMSNNTQARKLRKRLSRAHSTPNPMPHDMPDDLSNLSSEDEESVLSDTNEEDTWSEHAPPAGGEYVFGPNTAPSTSWQRKWRRIKAGGVAGGIYSIVYFTLLAPLHLAVSGCCFFFVVSVPMAKLNYVLLRHLLRHPLRLSSHWPEERRASAPARNVSIASNVPQSAVRRLMPVLQPAMAGSASRERLDGLPSPDITPDMIGSIIMSPGTPPGRSFPPPPQLANLRNAGSASASNGVRPISVFVDPGVGDKRDVAYEEEGYQIVLCTYSAIGLKYYKYTFDGVNIIFINLMAIVIFTLADSYYLGDLWHHKGLGSYTVIFFCALLSIVPLSYFIGMGVSSITAQTGSLALGAVINATFGSIIEVLLYSFALMEGKTRMVEGAIIGSFMAGLLALPGASMFTGGLKRKEQKFNSKAATVTSTMLIISVIGVFGPTLFQEVYGTFELQCAQCPVAPKLDVFVYGVGLWFTLRTHAKRIYKSKKKQRHSEPAHDFNGSSNINDTVFTPQTATPLIPSPSPAQPAPIPIQPSAAQAAYSNDETPRARPPVRKGPAPPRALFNARSTSRPRSGAGTPNVASPGISPARQLSNPGREISREVGLGITMESDDRQRRPSLNILIPGHLPPAVKTTAPHQPAATRVQQQSSHAARDDNSTTMDSSSDEDDDDDDTESEILSAVDSVRGVAGGASGAGGSNGKERPRPVNNITLLHPSRAQDKRLRHFSMPAGPMSAGPVLDGASRSGEGLRRVNRWLNRPVSGLQSALRPNASGERMRRTGKGKKAETAGAAAGDHNGGAEPAGHDHPNWSTGKSVVVLLGATILFSMVAEVLIQAVDHVVESDHKKAGESGRWVIDEKFLGLTLFALAPTATEFYNAIAFAQAGNIALSLEIGSAYTIQVALLQIPSLLTGRCSGVRQRK
ncbi:hypothetical protein HK101_010317 [Irineochytrium annulatum]|nr:hypothetical protein HK101_010317 [Irineochytrium annulatum]